VFKAVCCSDGKHCCSSGFKCEVSTGKCTKGPNFVVDWVEKEPATLRAENVMCLDGRTECKTGQTCCKLASGNYGCCPVPNVSILQMEMDLIVCVCVWKFFVCRRLIFLMSTSQSAAFDLFMAM
jgi:hypothetical protein